VLEDRATSPGYIEIGDIIARAGDLFTLLGNEFAPIQNVSHTLKVTLSDKPIFDGPATVNLGGYFRTNIPLPGDTRPGIYELEVTILPERLRNSIKIAVCGLDGKGCTPRIGILSSKVKHTVTTFFGPTTFEVGASIRLIGNGYHVPANDGFSPVATAEIWIDRSCPRGGTHCVERGIQVATTDVYFYRGAGTFAVPVYFPTSLDVHSAHGLQAYVNGQVAEILFRLVPATF
jgi:hypothetical protein